MRSLITAVLPLVVFPMIYSTANGDGRRPTVAVYADSNSPNISQATQLADILANQIVAKGDLAVIDRQHTQAILSEQATSSQGQVTPATQAQLGRMLGVNYIVVVRIESLTATNEQRMDVLSILSKQASYVAKLNLDDSVSVVDVRSAQIVQTLNDEESTTSSPSATTNNEGYIQQAVTPLLKTSATALATKLDLAKLSSAVPAARASGRILEVSGDSVTLSIGASAGLQVGQMVDVFTAHSVLNPDTGKTIQTLIKQGSLQITQVEPDYSIASPIGGFRAIKFQIIRQSGS